MTELRQEIDSQTARLDTAIQEQQTTFLAAQDKRLQEFSDSQKQLESALKQEVAELLANKTGLMDEKIADASKSAEALRDAEEQAKRIVGVTAATGVTGSFKDEASVQKKDADVWRFIAMALLVAVVAAGVATTLWSPLRGDVSTEHILEYGLTRVPLVAILAGVFGYAARQSSEHRERERRAKQTAMELTAFRPFLAELEDDKRNMIIAKATLRYFPGDRDSQTPPRPTG